MIPYFGASVYDDPAVYAKSSAIDFIKQREDADAGCGGRARRRMPRAAIVRILARAEDAGREDARWWSMPTKATCSTSRKIARTCCCARSPGLTKISGKRECCSVRPWSGRVRGVGDGQMLPYSGCRVSRGTSQRETLVKPLRGGQEARGALLSGTIARQRTQR